jgi:hypothetical protein
MALGIYNRGIVAEKYNRGAPVDGVQIYSGVM